MHKVTLAFTCLLAAVIFSPVACATDYQPVAPGVSFMRISDPAGPWSINVTKFDYTRPNLRLTTTHAHGTVFGLATVPEQVAALSKSAGHPIAAINGDFFLIDRKPYQGDPHGLQIIDGELSSGPGKELTFWIDNTGKPHFDRVKAEFKVTVAGSTFNVALNETRTDTNATLLTPTLGASTRTSNGVEIVLRNTGTRPWLPLHGGTTYSAQVAEVHDSGNTPLRPDTMVLSLGPKLAETLPTISTGAEANISLVLTPSLEGVRTAIGGNPALVRKGKNLQLTPKRKDSMYMRNPRTAIGWNDHEFFMVVVDGRQKNFSVGMTFGELATLMLKLGCKDALNLDGGGSSTMWLNGKVVNHTSEKGVLRHVANTLVLLQSP
ncbi:MAG: hypothetical protein JWO95_452 [Verrucomicrobiales bacterium]|nr:hypothetical protein [Verrucomicrobiales bacterium]